MTIKVRRSQWARPGQIITAHIGNDTFLIVPESISPWALALVEKMVAARNSFDHDVEYIKRLLRRGK